MKNKPLKNKFKVIKNSTSFLDEENKKLIDNELSYLADLSYPKKNQDELDEFAKNYSEENDDETDDEHRWARPEVSQIAYVDAGAACLTPSPPQERLAVLNFDAEKRLPESLAAGGRGVGPGVGAAPAGRRRGPVPACLRPPPSAPVGGGGAV